MSHGDSVDPSRLTPAQIRALSRAAYCELAWGLRDVALELGRWRHHAHDIPEPALRSDALDALRKKRTNTDGAAVFATLAEGRNLTALRLLAVYQALWDYLDSSVERHPTEENGRELHLALVEALELDGPLSDYYRHHPWDDDGGYLVDLVQHCRARCRELPSYGEVRSAVLQEARRAQVQALNHLPRRELRDAALARWAAREGPPESETEWFETTAAASASLVILPLLALSARPSLSTADVAQARAAYWPWVTVATTMLDNYADQTEDIARGNHNYFTHYSDEAIGVARLCDCIDRALRRVGELPNGERHLVIVASMIAMYLSKSSDGATSSWRAKLRLAKSGGSLVLLLVPILRVWRVAYRQLDN